MRLWPLRRRAVRSLWREASVIVVVVDVGQESMTGEVAGIVECPTEKRRKQCGKRKIGDIKSDVGKCQVSLTS